MAKSNILLTSYSYECHSNTKQICRWHEKGVRSCKLNIRRNTLRYCPTKYILQPYAICRAAFEVARQVDWQTPIPTYDKCSRTHGENQMEILISVILTVVITAPSVYFFTKKITLETLKLECEKNFQISKNNLQESVIKNHKSEDGYKAILSNEYIRGKIDGSKEELEKFSISYQPFIERINGMIWDDAAIGYEMQIFYAGFSIGEPTRKITNHEKKFKALSINNLNS